MKIGSILNTVLFEENTDDFKKISNDQIIKILKLSSSQLLLPALYINIINKGLEKYFDDDFIEYLKNIFEINKNRNNKLLKELFEIEKIFKSEKINYTITKGAFLIKNKYFSDVGERMIGDIDILIKKKDLKNAYRILKKKNYNSDFTYKLWKTKHLPRLINEKNIFALELHEEVVIWRHKNLYPSSEIFKKIKINSALTACEILIMNFMINDYGNLKAQINYRVMYDFKKISSKININQIDLNNKYYRRFLFMLRETIPFNLEIKLLKTDFVFTTRIRLKRNLRYFYYVDDVLCNTLINLFKYPMQLLEFIVNENYRKNVISKLRNSSLSN